MPGPAASRARLGAAPSQTGGIAWLRDGGSGTCVVAGERIARYGFPDGHPFGPGPARRVLARTRGAGPRPARACCARRARATRAELELFHDPAYVDFVVARSATGRGIAGRRRHAGLQGRLRGRQRRGRRLAGRAWRPIMAGRARRAFVPIAGLHHAGRRTRGRLLRLQRLRRRDRDAASASTGSSASPTWTSTRTTATASSMRSRTTRPSIFADIHEDGRFLYPGTGRGRRDRVRRRGRAPSSTCRCRPGAGDDEFLAAWPRVEAHLERHAPEFILFQCGADSLAGDPITHLRSPRRRTACRGAPVRARRSPRVPGASSASAAAATTGATSRGPGPRSSQAFVEGGLNAGLSGRLRAPFSARPAGTPMFGSGMSIDAFDPELAARDRRRAPPPGGAPRADRLGELREPARARGAGLGAHQQVRRGLSGQALLRRLRVRGRRRAARDRRARSSCSAPPTPTCSRTPARRRMPPCTSRCCSRATRSSA